LPKAKTKQAAALYAIKRESQITFDLPANPERICKYQTFSFTASSHLQYEDLYLSIGKYLVAIPGDI